MTDLVPKNRESEATASADMLQALLDERYSCRAFQPQPVPRATIDRILAMAQRTASWCNAQPWQMHVFSGAATQHVREELLAYVRTNEPQSDLPFPQAYLGKYLERRRECGWQLYQATGVARGDHEGSDRQRLENYRFFGAPHVAIVTAHAPLGVYGAIDCGAYVGNFMLAARSLGVDSIAMAAQAAQARFWRERLQLHYDRNVVCGIAFGYQDPQHPANAFRTSRAPIQEAVDWIE